MCAEGWDMQYDRRCPVICSHFSSVGNVPKLGQLSECKVEFMQQTEGTSEVSMVVLSSGGCPVC